MNALYGALGSPAFRYYDKRIAESITTSGQLMNRLVEHNLNKLLNEKMNTVDKDYIITMDTDSVTGDTIININNKDISIEDYYNSKDNERMKGDNNYYKDVGNDFTLSVNKSFNEENKRVQYIKKHEVKKRMYRITTGKNSVVVTEDHSIMVKRGNKLLSLKPKEILKSDELIIN